MKTMSKIDLYSQIPFENQSQKSPKSAGSAHSKQECRYCLCEEAKEKLIQPCNCEGSLKYVHNSCLGEWIKNSQKPYEIIYENDTAYYTSVCEICKYSMKYQINFENNFFISFINTMKNTLFSIKSCFFLLLHSLVIFYFFNRLTFLVYNGIYVVNKNFKTKYLMRFVNEMAIFSTILWYTNDIVRYYGNLYFEQRKSLLVFMPKKKKQNCQLQTQPSQFSFEVTVEKINSNTSVAINNVDINAIKANINNADVILNEISYSEIDYDTSCHNLQLNAFENNLTELNNEEEKAIKNRESKYVNLNVTTNYTDIYYKDFKVVNAADDQIRNSNSFVDSFGFSNLGIINKLNAKVHENNGVFYEIEFN